MKTVDVKTPQNVVLELQLAGFGHRLGAFLLDQIIFWVSVLLLDFFANKAGNISGHMEEVLFWLVVFPLYVFYSAVFELFFSGQTPGKRIVQIRVIRLDGGRVQLDEVLSRWFMRIFDIVLTSGALGALMVLSSKYSQRVGDVLGGTIVVRDKSEKSVDLAHVTNLETTDNYEAKYATAYLLSEDEAMLLKRTIIRFEKNGTEGHKAAIDELASKLEEVLNIQREEKKTTDFLRKVLKDYIVLTR